MVGRAVKLLMPLYGGNKSNSTTKKINQPRPDLPCSLLSLKWIFNTFPGLLATTKIHGVLLVQPAEEKCHVELVCDRALQ